MPTQHGAVGRISFNHFSDHLYCAGAEERLCALPHSTARTHPGECMWYKPDHLPVSHDDMVEGQRGRWSKDTWDAVAAGGIAASEFTSFSKAAAGACLRSKHVLILGESTTRDLFYEFALHAGLRPTTGSCMNTRAGGPICTRVVDGGHDNSTRISFQFLSKANASREMDITKGLIDGRTPDAVFVYCMMYDWIGPLFAGDNDDMGSACMELIDRTILSAAPRVPIYLLGPVYPPNWVSPYENRTRSDSVMARVFSSIHRGTGIRCVRGGPEHKGDYHVVSSRGLKGPIDRYNVVGHRKRDRIHPFPNAHAPVVQMMLNWMCAA